MISTMSYLKPSVPLLLSLVNRASLTLRSTPIFKNVLVSCSALGSWPPSLDLEMRWLLLTLTRSPITKFSTYHHCSMEMFYLSCPLVGSPPLLLRTTWMVWIRGLMVTHATAPLLQTFITIMASLLGSPLVLAIWNIITKIMISCLYIS
jgi:hypothetical protein